MKNLCKTLILTVAAVSCGIMSAPSASADVVIRDTSTWPATIDYSMSDPIILSEPAVIDSSIMTPTVVTSPAVVTTPTVVNTSPVILNDDPHLLHVGLPFFDFSLF